MATVWQVADVRRRQEVAVRGGMTAAASIAT
jgi:hypothetical protein